MSTLFWCWNFLGKRLINQLGSNLKMTNHCLESAFMFYKMAVSKRFTSGRRTIHVIGACLYLVSRTEKTPRKLQSRIKSTEFLEKTITERVKKMKQISLFLLLFLDMLLDVCDVVQVFTLKFIENHLINFRQRNIVHIFCWIRSILVR